MVTLALTKIIDGPLLLCLYNNPPHSLNSRIVHDSISVTPLIESSIESIVSEFERKSLNGRSIVSLGSQTISLNGQGISLSGQEFH